MVGLEEHQLKVVGILRHCGLGRHAIETCGHRSRLQEENKSGVPDTKFHIHSVSHGITPNIGACPNVRSAANEIVLYIVLNCLLADKCRNCTTGCTTFEATTCKLRGKNGDLSRVSSRTTRRYHEFPTKAEANTV